MQAADIPWSVGSTRYNEAFWWVVPIPAAILGGAVLTLLRPSLGGVAALALLVAVGLGVEFLFWRTFRRRWAGDRDAHPISGINARTRGFLSGAVLWVAFVLALAAKGVGLGYDAPTIAAAIAIGIGALLLTGWLMIRYSGRG
jgi:hypothetical protein